MAYLEVRDGEKIIQRELVDNGTTRLVEGKGTIETIAAGSGIHNVLRGDILISRSSRGWVLLDYQRHKTRGKSSRVIDCKVNGLRVADCKRLREGDVIQIGRIEAILFEIQCELLDKDSPLVNSNQLCYICHSDDGFKAGDRVAYCSVCGSAHHVECWLCAGEGDVYEVGCANCGAPHWVNRKLYCAQDDEEQPTDQISTCPHCGQPLASADESATLEDEAVLQDD